MPRFVHVVESDYKETFRTSKVASMFDVSPSEKLVKKWDVNLPLEEKVDKFNYIQLTFKH